jgi:hypothetical protein
MKWFDHWRPSRSIITAYYFQLGILLILGIYGISAVDTLRRDFDKIFSQKLIPAMDISRMLELQFQNRYHLEDFLNSNNQMDRLQYMNDIHHNNRSIDSLLDVYLSGSAVLPQEETKDLKDFSRFHRSYRKEENLIISLSGIGDSIQAKERFRFQSNFKFTQMVAPMEKFEEVELKLAKNILEEVKDEIRKISWVLYCAMIIAVMLAIWIGLRISKHHLEN